MDARRFDSLVQSFSDTNRRRVLHLLAGLPLMSGLSVFLADTAETLARRRQHANHVRHVTVAKHKHKKHKKCAKAGQATSKKRKKCCKGLVKGADGRCVTPASPLCADTCGGCCDGETCHPGETSAACGSRGAACVACGGATPVCIDHTCTAACADANPCPGGQVCCSGECFSGICCEDPQCAPTGNQCHNHQCQCFGGPPCAGDPELCCDDGCTNTDTDHNNCGACGHDCSGATPLCWNGTCVCGDVCPSGCRWQSVQNAIIGSLPNSVIHICAGTYTENISIAKDLFLVGAGSGNTTLQGTGSGSVVTIEAGVTAALQSLTVTGGSTSGDGGGISSQGAALTMTNCVVSDNSAAVRGGGIYNEAGTLTLTGCTLSENTATDFGSPGGGIFHSAGAARLTNCSVSNNSAGYRGGGIWNGGSFRLDGTSVTSNHSGFNGGGIFTYAGGSLTLENGSSVTGNHADGPGGGIYNQGIVSCSGGSTVSGNTPNNCVNGGTSGTGCDTCPV